MGKVSAIFKLTRIEHSLMLVVAVIAAELIAGGLPSLSIFIASLITPIFVSMAAFAINDYFDVEVDKANKKKGPLVTGELSRSSALYITTICLVVGIAASAFINLYCVVIAVIFGALAMLYSYRLKEVLLLGNIYIAFAMVIPFIYGSYVKSGSGLSVILIVSAMIFLSGLAREIHGTVRDLEGDKARRVNSLPRIMGWKAASYVAFILYLAAIGISAYLFRYVLPFLNNLAYGLPIIVSDVLLLYISSDYLSRTSAEFYKNARNISLVAMALALLAILLGAAFFI